MVIIIGNQKGGAGKSTLTLMLANYLTQAKKCAVTVIDMDYQQSIAQKFEKAKLLENAEPYEVIAANLENYPDMLEILKASGDQVVLIDLPGKLDDDGLIPVFKSADLVICPFAYDEFSFDSTILFSVVLRKINPDVTISYIPNRIKANVKYDTQVEVDEQLSKFGNISSAIPDRIDFQRTNTVQTPLSVLPVIIRVFDKIYKDHLINNL
ncbi:ParA family protein [Pedobacter sp. ISL-68]|uniref:ParA family protein n=1 Tax=unclassified Pedobacter TaxID=2628915 RepID=UPI001BE7B810|nr:MULTISPECIES: ParA family protein [unclassified Pedobacter]MBT2560117.1 ParA family protein [Pedobacter sp. ISL-64]MBT2589096.1 ParA family protein [Pedobacter sp. ISL-68]